MPEASTSLPSSSSRWRPRRQPALGEHMHSSVEEFLLFSTSAGRPNLLLEGPESQVDAVVFALRPHLPGPLAAWCGGALPAEHRGTLIVQGAHRLDASQQQQLMQWLDDTQGTVRVIATSEPLFPLVGRGAFLDALYYRLNVIRVEVPAQG
jgi:hypothetical protein